VDVHTKEVVANLLASPEYEALEAGAKWLVELAAYLHDIGKGPRSRWDKSGGVQRVDLNHPVRAMPMMVDVLTRQIASVTQESADIVTKLVCYHDLVGDVLGNGRDEQQIVDVVADEEQLDMLFALGKADATALADWEWDEEEAGKLYDRCLAAVE
jgi:UTP:GlnB (protein PII) uridylyltransferase